jgi:hypothetical protein
VVLYQLVTGVAPFSTDDATCHAARRGLRGPARTHRGGSPPLSEG